MNREQMIKLANDRSFFLKVRNPDYLKGVRRFFQNLLGEDLGDGDITTNAVLKDGKTKAIIVSNEPGVLAGGEEFRWLYRENDVSVKPLKKDGEKFGRNETLFEIEGPKKLIFYLERTGLNILQRMSGVATETREMVDRVRRTNYNLAIAGTRKTHWGYLDKKAVTIGGGFSHRLGLWESFLIKDNHLDSLRKQGVRNPIEFAIEKAWESRKKSVFIEVEVKNPKEAMEAAGKYRELQTESKETKPCIIMLDNIKPEDIKKIVQELKENDLYDHVLLEASGGVTKEDILEYARAGVDVCSLGCLTHSTKAIDISQKVF
ncbi:MAG: carboxylating nicotinate-nucleotide diphosphorylase [Candidatus Aenigmatarchaeota archaeon]|nr:MAG: carboxylating nicotinate-nucleotide diphosphorylase [Candidatus Aenigmarchaeota archaeon]